MPSPLPRRGYAPWAYLLLARFGADKSAPLGSPLAVDVGSLTVTDASNKLSASGGQLLLTGATANYGSYAVGAGLARTAGRALLGTLAPNNAGGGILTGWSASATPSDANLRYATQMNATTDLRIRLQAGTNMLTDTLAASAGQHHAVILRATGALIVVDGKLRWVSAADATATMYPFLSSLGSTAGGAWDDFRVLDLPAPWNSDYGIATAYIPTTSANSTLTATADCVIEHTVTAATGVAQELHVRRQDATNKWIVRMAAPGTDTIKLIELVAGVETERASSAQTFANATQYRVVVTCDGSTIKTYVADVAKNSYASATNFQTATGVLVDTAGSNLVAWPRYISLPAGV